MATQIGIIGLGMMGGALATRLQPQFEIEATTRSEESALEATKKLGIRCHTNNVKLVKSSPIILLCVKPHQAQEVLRSIQKVLTSEHLIISICASVTIEQLEQWSGGKAVVVRAMPNTPCLIGEGMTAFCTDSKIQKSQMALAGKILGSVGKTVVVEESLLDGVTGLSGCGPAYIYLILESLSDAGVKVGLPRKTASLLAAQTMLGSAKMMLERGEHPAALKDSVTTPAGCTIDGLMVLEEGKLRATLIKAVVAATQKSKGLGK